jgi:hypothetical protein
MKKLFTLLLLTALTLSAIAQESDSVKTIGNYIPPTQRFVWDTVEYKLPNTKSIPEDFGRIHPSYYFNEDVKANLEPSGVDPTWLMMVKQNTSLKNQKRFAKRMWIGSPMIAVGVGAIIYGYSLPDATYVYYNGNLVLDGDGQKQEAMWWKIGGGAVALTGLIIDIDAIKFAKRAKLNIMPDKISVTYPLWNTNPVINR